MLELSKEQKIAFKQNAIDRIYQEITKVIGGGDQLFCMTFPGQPLNKKKFKYDTSNYASVLTKPWLVEEEEFRLSDQLFDLSPIVQATNGKKLSVIYEELLNNYLPKLNELAHYFKDRAGLAGFLTEDSGEVDDDGKPLTRIELCKKLYQAYLVEKEKWEQEKRNKILELKDETKDATEEERDEALDDYAQWHSAIATVKQAELDNLYNEVVVTGHLHEVMTILGYLDAASVAELLEKNKQNIRHSRRISLDESMDIYPVQFIPNNWAEMLTPNLHPKDLTMSEDVLVASFRCKRKELLSLKEQLKEIELLNIDPSKVEALQKDVDQARDNFNDAEANVISQYGESVVDAVKIYLNATSGWNLGLMEDIGRLVEQSEDAPEFDPKKVEKLGLDAIGPIQAQVDALKTATQQLMNVYKGEKETIEKARKLTELQAKLAQAKTQNMTLQKERLQKQIASLQDDIDYLGAMVSGVYSLNESYQKSGQYVSDTPVTITILQKGKKAGSDATEPGVSARQKIELNKDIDGGTFKLSFDGSTTDDLKYDITNEALQTKLEVLDGLTSDNIVVSGSYDKGWTVDFKDDLSNKDVPDFTVNPTDIKLTKGGQLIPTIADNRPELNVLPERQSITEVDGLFSDITITLDSQEDKALTTQSSEASHSSWGASAWFASAGAENSRSTAVSDQESAAFNSKIDIGFRVAKVTFDRGGWFNPGLFDLAHNGDFYRLSELRAGSDITKSKLDEWRTLGGNNVLERVSQGLQYSYIAQDGSTASGMSLLPCYPVAMVIAKDITFKIAMDQSQSSQINTSMQQSSSYGGGFLCFHHSHAESSSNSSQSSFHGHQGKHYYIRVPGPQILGYVLQLTPKDNTEIKPSFRDADDKLTFIEALQDFDKYATTMFPGLKSKVLPSVKETDIHPHDVFNIIGLVDGTVVEATHPVGGIIDDPTAEIWIMTHVVGSDSYVVDAHTQPKGNGEWSSFVSFGRAGTDAGKKVEIRAVVNPVEKLHSDKTLESWPEAERTTEMITVQREQTVARL